MKVGDVQDIVDRLEPDMEVVDGDGEKVTSMEVIDGKLVIYFGEES